MVLPLETRPTAAASSRAFLEPPRKHADAGKQRRTCAASEQLFRTCSGWQTTEAHRPDYRCCVSQVDDPPVQAYSTYWEGLLRKEYRELADSLKERRAKWPTGRLEATGLAIIDAYAAPELLPNRTSSARKLYA